MFKLRFPLLFCLSSPNNLGNWLIGKIASAFEPINQLPKLLGLDKQQNGNLSLNIENFNNNREQDVKELVEEIAFYLKRKNIAVGGV